MSISERFNLSDMCTEFQPPCLQANSGNSCFAGSDRTSENQSGQSHVASAATSRHYRSCDSVQCRRRTNHHRTTHTHPCVAPFPAHYSVAPQRRRFHCSPRPTGSGYTARCRKPSGPVAPPAASPRRPASRRRRPRGGRGGFRGLAQPRGVLEAAAPPQQQRALLERARRRRVRRRAPPATGRPPRARVHSNRRPRE